MNAGRPRVLILNWRDPTNPKAGGAEVHVWKVFTVAQRRGWDVRAICCRYPNCREQEDVEGIRVRRIGNEWSYWFAWIGAFKSTSKTWTPDLVVDCLNKLPLYSPLFTNLPVVCFTHHLFGSAARWEAKFPFSTVLRLSERFVPRIYKDAHFLTGSQSSREELVSLGVHRDRIQVVPYGVDTHQYAPGERSHHPTLLYVGRIKRYKRIDHVIRVLPALRQVYPDIVLNVVGSGDYQPQLVKLAQQLGVRDQVLFYGYVEEAAKLNLLQSAWLLCYPSVKEGFGLSVPEAALCETPTVAYDVPGLRDAVQHEKTGILVPDNDLESFTNAVQHLMVDRKKRIELGKRARALYSDWTWERAAEQTLTLLEGLIRHQKSESRFS